MRIRVGSRESRLAVIQSEIIIAKIREYDPSAEIELVTMKTTGDKILDRTLDKVGGKGLFVKELDRALIEGEVDITVHSLKDMPVPDNKELPIIAYSERKNPFDALILPKGATEIKGAIGCASMRRTALLKRLYPDIEVRPVRGNVLTRLDKLDRGEYGALVLACAGLERLGLGERISRVFTPEEMLPAAGQGIIAVQGRKDGDYPWIDAVNSRLSEVYARAERAFIRELEGGCSNPSAAYAQAEGETLIVRGMNLKNGELLFDELKGGLGDAESMGIELAKRLK